jgi:hypothetical protein
MVGTWVKSQWKNQRAPGSVLDGNQHPAFRQTSPIGVPSSACFNTKAICASVNFDVFMELSLSRSRDHKWKIPVPIGPIFWEHVWFRGLTLVVTRAGPPPSQALPFEPDDPIGDDHHFIAGCGMRTELPVASPRRSASEGLSADTHRYNRANKSYARNGMKAV